MISNQKVAKSSDEFLCEICHYCTSKKFNFDKHLLTSKHINSIIINQKVGKVCKSSTQFVCPNCNKIYKDNSGLWRHKKKCNSINEMQNNNNDITSLTNLVLEVVKQNSELQKSILDICKNGTNNQTIMNSNNTNNSHNKTFNLNVFLNETCKDAINLTDFIDSVKLQLSDLEQIGENGFVKGISNIIIKNLKALDVTERPVHCTDSKRETLYIKDEDKWEKENEHKTKLKKAIKRVANKNINLLSEFKAKYPDCIFSESKKSDEYNKIIIEAFELDNLEKQEKIIKNIAKEVKIDKEI